MNSSWFFRFCQALLLTLVPQFPAFASDDPIIPQQGNTLQSFVPEGYEIGDEVHGDFNGDGKEDIAAIFWVSPDSTKTRPLIILLAQQEGTYQLSARTDRFTITEEEDCGVGNLYCVPQLQVKKQSLVISVASGSGGEYNVYENEFKLIKSVWYQVRHSDYTLGEQTCQEPTEARKDERCIEQGLSSNFKTGVTSRYCQFVNDNGKQTRIYRTRISFSKVPLKDFSEAEWESSNDEDN